MTINTRDYPAIEAEKLAITPGMWTALTAIWPTAPNSDVILRTYDTALARGWDPMKGHAALVEQRAKDKSGNWSSTWQVWPTLKSLVYTAHRTNAFAGMDPVVFGPTITKSFKGSIRVNNQNQHQTMDISFPEWVSCTVYRIVGGQRFPFTETVYFEEMAAMRDGLPVSMWRTKPRLMATKCAKSAALRTAFSECDFSADEMDGQSVEMADVIHFTPERAETGLERTARSSPVDGEPISILTDQPSPDRGDGEAILSFTALDPDALTWLAQTLKTALPIKAFAPVITNMRATLRHKAQDLGASLFNAAQIVSASQQAAGMWAYVDKTITAGAYSEAIRGLTNLENKGQISADECAALTTLPSFHQAYQACVEVAA